MISLVLLFGKANGFPKLSKIDSLPFEEIVIVSSPLGVPSILKYTQILSYPPNNGPDGPGRCKSSIVA